MSIFIAFGLVIVIVIISDFTSKIRYKKYIRSFLSAEEEKLLLEKIKEKTLKQGIKIKISKADNLALTASKFGGIPYWNSKEKKYPLDSEGDKLYLLAQIDCAELPRISTLADFPNTGLLQFFISSNFLNGLDIDDFISSKGWQVIYWENIDKNITKEDILAQNIPNNFSVSSKKIILPFYKEYSLNFNVEETYMGEQVYNFYELLKKTANELKINIPDDKYNLGFLDDYDCPNSGHWIAAYPYFTQDYDPREDYPNYDILLLQIDSELGINWGDAGVANFFITAEDLKNKDFSKVLFYWDCT